MTVTKKGIAINAESGTLIGFMVGIVTPILLLFLTGAKLGVFSLVAYLFLSVIGVVAFALYNTQKRAQVFWAGVMVVCAFVMLFVLPVAVVISIGLVMGSGLLLLKSLTQLREF